VVICDYHESIFHGVSPTIIFLKSVSEDRSIMNESRILIIGFLTAISLLCIAYAGAVQFKDLGEITGSAITRTDEMRSFEAYRFRFNGDECRLSIQSIAEDSVDFAFQSSSYTGEEFSLKIDEFRSIDVNDDGKVDFSIKVSSITKTPSKERAEMTLSTEGILPGKKSNDEGDGPESIEEADIEMPAKPARNVTDINLTEYSDSLEKQEEAASQPKEVVSSEKFNLAVWAAVALITIIIGGGFYLLYRKNQDMD